MRNQPASAWVRLCNGLRNISSTGVRSCSNARLAGGVGPGSAARTSRCLNSRDFTNQRGYIRDEARPGEVTLRDVLLREWEIVQTAKEGRCRSPSTGSESASAQFGAG